MIAREYLNWTVEVWDQAGTRHIYEVRNLWSPNWVGQSDTCETSVETAAIAEMRSKGIAAIKASATLQ